MAGLHIALANLRRTGQAKRSGQPRANVQTHFAARTALADQPLQNAINNALGPSAEEQMVSIEIVNSRRMAIGDAETPFDTAQNQYRNDTRLTVRVHYMYMMQVPFANWIIQQAWLAAAAGRRLYGAIGNPQDAAGETGFGDAGGVQPFNTRYQVVQALAAQRIFVVPLTATYTMRMQSDVYRRSL
ncbi:MAG: hypothetical protein V1754_04475 [Pseudomonadota bacterium]